MMHECSMVRGAVQQPELRLATKCCHPKCCQLLRMGSIRRYSRSTGSMHGEVSTPRRQHVSCQAAHQLMLRNQVSSTRTDRMAR